MACKLGRILIKMGKVNRDQVQEALDLQKQRRLPLGQLLVELGYVKEEDVNLALAYQAGMEALDLEKLTISPRDHPASFPAETAQAYQVVPLMYDDRTNTLTVALKSASNFRAIDDLRLLMGYNVKPVVADPAQVENLLKKFYGKEEESLKTLIDELTEDDRFSDLKDIKDPTATIDLQTLIEAAEDNKVKRLLNLVLMQAIKDKASDVHFEPFDDEFKMRYRIDGVLYEMIPPPKYLAMPIISRIKVMSNLDIAERRMPQDGRIELVVNGAPVDLRVAVLPTMFGESVVMRVLDRSNIQLDLAKLGLRPDDLGNLPPWLTAKPNGIVIVTGPTGSGKTTTLYAALNELNTIDTKILTAEDPVEYDIDGLVQIQINHERRTRPSAKALRSFLRQDPDIILVGETRDLETAQIGVQASLTGHLVFTTLHTNDAPSSIARLLDLPALDPLPGDRHARRHRRPARSSAAKNLRPRLAKEAYEPTDAQQSWSSATHPRRPPGHARSTARPLGCELLQQQRLQGPHGHLRDHGHQRRDPRTDHAERLHPGPPRRIPQTRHAHPAPGRPDGHLRRRHHHRRESCRENGALED